MRREGGTRMSVVAAWTDTAHPTRRTPMQAVSWLAPICLLSSYGERAKPAHTGGWRGVVQDPFRSLCSRVARGHGRWGAAAARLGTAYRADGPHRAPGREHSGDGGGTRGVR